MCWLEIKEYYCVVDATGLRVVQLLRAMTVVLGLILRQIPPPNPGGKDQSSFLLYAVDLLLFHIQKRKIEGKEEIKRKRKMNLSFDCSVVDLESYSGLKELGNAKSY